YHTHSKFAIQRFFRNPKTGQPTRYSQETVPKINKIMRGYIGPEARRFTKVGFLGGRSSGDISTDFVLLCPLFVRCLQASRVAARAEGGPINRLWTDAINRPLLESSRILLWRIRKKF